MGNHEGRQVDTIDEADEMDFRGPQTFEEALAFALKVLADSSPSLPPDWLAALNREKESSSR
jgi:hypothetical protein